MGGFLSSIIGSGEQLLGIGPAPDYYAAAESTANTLSDIAQGTIAAPSPNASMIARQYQMALQSTIARLKQSGLSGDALNRVMVVAHQHLMSGYQSAIEQDTNTARSNMMQALQSKIGVQQNDAAYRAANNASNVDFARGIATMFAGNALGFGKSPTRAVQPGQDDGGYTEPGQTEGADAPGGMGPKPGMTWDWSSHKWVSSDQKQYQLGYGSGYGSGGYGGLSNYFRP
jgi:hypothetical protein